ncbi:MAG: hypothetical protein EA389_10250 [Ilumatobacter sp.]|nr:MAG: hypothetical protein EA389_10250 [Ilumatobacter sp.]
MQLMTEELLDCQGRTTHRLVLELDGTVTVTFMSSGTSARIDTERRTVLTPGVHVAPQLMNAACGLRVR